MAFLKHSILHALSVLLLAWVLVQCQAPAEPEEEEEEEPTEETETATEVTKSEAEICPQDCSCTAEGVVDCPGVNLIEFPAKLSEKTRQLSLQRNKLEKIPAGAFDSLPNLRELYLQNNLLSNEGMDNETFSQLSSLECLDLSNNNLSVVPKGLPRSLVLLHLEKNDIRSIPGDALTSARNLEYLLLHNNKLRSRSIHPAAFQGLKKLHTLHMHNNLLERVPRGLPRRAKTLMLLHNSISEIGRNDLTLLYTLIELNLSYNKLTSPKMHREAFRKLRLLETLDLSGNSLTSMPRGLPRSLHVLEIKNNLINSIPDGTLTKMEKLRKLILSDNQLKLNSVYQGAWMELTALTVSGRDTIKNLRNCYSWQKPFNNPKYRAIVAQEFGARPVIGRLSVRAPARTVSVVVSLGKTLHLPPTGVGQKGRWRDMAALLLSVCPRAAVATTVACLHQFVNVCVNGWMTGYVKRFGVLRRG
uniref:LRRNT domain-containing protein n=1 Tax=Oreochromis aureus TaxID=47969 RepID=A0A668S9W9_OREAU